MTMFLQSRNELQAFLQELGADMELVAPVQEDLIRFRPVKDASLIQLNRNAYFPLKEFFFRKREVLFGFKGGSLSESEHAAPERAFFGVRRCDLNAVKRQDMVFLGENLDPYYAALRENSYLLGWHCTEPDSPSCFCGSQELEEFFDLMFRPRGEEVLVEIGSPRGQGLLDRYAEFFHPTDARVTARERMTPGTDRLEHKDIAPLYDHPDWKKGVDICYSCAACTVLPGSS